MEATMLCGGLVIWGVHRDYHKVLHVWELAVVRFRSLGLRGGFRGLLVWSHHDV